MTVSACIIATIGLLSNRAAVIVGAMIIAPLMLPLRGLALGALEGDVVLFRQRAIALSWSVGRSVNLPASEFTPELLARTQPTRADLGERSAASAINSQRPTSTEIPEITLPRFLCGF